MKNYELMIKEFISTAKFGNPEHLKTLTFINKISTLEKQQLQKESPINRKQRQVEINDKKEQVTVMLSNNLTLF